MCLAVWVTVACSVFVPMDTYLQSRVDRATETEIKEQMGSPIRKVTTGAGESQWVYQTRTVQAGDRTASVGTWCDEYVLTFDRQAVLRRWTHEAQLYGGELLPSCDLGGAVVKDQ
jgi:hypothetical protein